MFEAQDIALCTDCGALLSLHDQGTHWYCSECNQVFEWYEVGLIYIMPKKEELICVPLMSDQEGI